jgi:hypothetical protein
LNALGITLDLGDKFAVKNFDRKRANSLLVSHNETGIWQFESHHPRTCISVGAHHQFFWTKNPNTYVSTVPVSPILQRDFLQYLSTAR